ncbi:LAME_0H16380g1_1 [Lachancea meyersii CBS 8951]|uniref:LAME_0H16380g1_1 n=1 Tax=Lachancea meyersii CBS 8951 TaxID=1266667 RepID=A0A1G4KI52_9SACH|nr:LAME_0H16380g1_1 [Lachancea meyersii CBS 8951]
MILSLRVIARSLSALLVINLICLLIRKPFLPWFYHWMLACPVVDKRCNLFWQKWPFFEKLVWKILDQIETHYQV